MMIKMEKNMDLKNKYDSIIFDLEYYIRQT